MSKALIEDQARRKRNADRMVKACEDRNMLSNLDDGDLTPRNAIVDIDPEEESALHEKSGDAGTRREPGRTWSQSGEASGKKIEMMAISESPLRVSEQHIATSTGL